MEIEVVKDPSGLWRVRNAPLVSTGIEYPLSSGPHTFTESELMDAIAALEDPAVVEPRIHLGHTSEYNEALIGDAEMAFGRIDGSTMVMGDNNQTIYGDYLVPEWLGIVMPIAFPNRSVEGKLDAETVTGKKYDMIISYVSLLGIYWPGCQVLEDLPMWYGGDIPEGVEFDDALAAKLAPSLKVAARGGGMAKTLQADADTSRIRRQFYDQAMSGGLTTPEGVESTWWWWIRGERVADDGGLYLIVEDDDDGDLYRFDVSLAGDEVTFGDAVPVTVEYPAKTTASLAAVVAGMAVVDRELVVHASRADTGGPEHPTTKGASKMDDAKRKALAASVGLPEDATEEQINEKLRAVRAAAEEAGAEEALAGEGDDPDNPDKPDEDPAPAPVPVPPDPAPPAEGTAASTVTVDKETWEATKAGAALAQKHETDRVAASRKDIVDDAIKAGKFPPARREHYEKLLAVDFDGTKQQIDGLAAGIIPTTERGVLGNGDGEGATPVGGDGLPDDWFPDLAAKRAAAAAGPRAVTQAKEG